MVLLRLLSSRLFRRISHELFLRCHQGLVFVTAYALWRHVPSSSKVPRAYLLASGGIFLITLVISASPFCTEISASIVAALER